MSLFGRGLDFGAKEILEDRYDEESNADSICNDGNHADRMCAIMGHYTRKRPERPAGLASSNSDRGSESEG